VNQLEGTWRIERLSGLLPPAGLSKEFTAGRGWTRVVGIRVASFDVQGTALVYRLLPLRDELEELPDGSWSGRGLVFGRSYCRFRLLKG
jgi:hypothetical protein